ncbi:hypothetical protein OJ996_24630 [Luteolibacter sp. GHJ8]|uniref:Uncharacterized protein n=1 Tax=Luteolibacter rhizosphaerae TaxID=2989719 RepID=A0ABT3GAD4_9BACT|nr:hypothetical protein [Luteolibacter rhizosphaerae]MCW1916797.1 hypothetical protein [Luteolibacter rhizosphaerae]
MELLVREVDARERLAYVPWCDLYALLCNLLGGGKRTWTRADFLPDEEGQEKAPPAEVEAGLREYAEAVAKSRERMRGE